jgi:hypothetical protein
MGSDAFRNLPDKNIIVIIGLTDLKNMLMEKLVDRIKLVQLAASTNALLCFTTQVWYNLAKNGWQTFPNQLLYHIQSEKQIIKHNIFPLKHR